MKGNSICSGCAKPVPPVLPPPPPPTTPIAVDIGAVLPATHTTRRTSATWARAAASSSAAGWWLRRPPPGTNPPCASPYCSVSDKWRRDGHTTDHQGATAAPPPPYTGLSASMTMDRSPCRTTALPRRPLPADAAS
ncbi:hypothetical protein Vafri_19572, partial [Volvox africanus]